MFITENLIRGSSRNPASVFFGRDDNNAMPVAAVAVVLIKLRRPGKEFFNVCSFNKMNEELMCLFVKANY